ASSAAAAAAPTSPAVSSSPLTSALMNGDGTWYGEDCGEEPCWQGGACAFVDYVLPASIAGSTCVSEVIWNSSYNCGGCVEITYKGKKKIAMITNKTGGDAVHLDMSPDMFSQLADKSLGEIDMQWAHVACPITTPLQIRMHGGSSQYWFAATVENATLRTASLEVSTDSGATWKPTVRNINNFFEFAKSGGTGTTTAWIRVTSETGSQVVVKDVKMISSTVSSATSNYA
ncbi:RlpA-like double-psi beta-barrel-protein domain-containing protein-containing protein, partial [Rhexocercosporidium sp. MPI-PUGE-AT-0058]